MDTKLDNLPSISIDCMGGDYAPSEIVKGVIVALNRFDFSALLVGKKDDVEREISKYNSVNRERIEVVDATDVVGMAEKPTDVLKKKESSLYKAVKLVKDGKADAVISAGNTGAVLVSSMFILGRIEGIDRPAIATPVPSIKGVVVLIDAGANIEVKPQHYLDFARMGMVYSRILGKDDPKVGLLNIGEEKEKGGELLREVHELLESELGDTFFGNVQGRDVNLGTVDVVVTDGFTGNVVLKTMEGTAKFITSMIKEVIEEGGMMTKFGALMMKRGFKKLKEKLDYRSYGGAFLLGVKGISIIAHGSSDAYAIMNAIRVALDGVRMDLIRRIEGSMS
ncbi:MAG: phosphate acyltransferase PlsX [Thermotoga sp.]|nr:MAG: phosphate acyltransferase PlsX [Thermotoga sp.]